MDQDNKKRLVAQRALDYIPDRSTLGVGTGSTVDLLIELLPSVCDRIETTVSSSERSSEGLRQQGFEVEDLNSSGGVDVYIDGADEATIHRQLIKGGGGAMTREKIVAAAARNSIRKKKKVRRKKKKVRRKKRKVRRKKKKVRRKKKKVRRKKKKATRRKKRKVRRKTK